MCLSDVQESPSALTKDGERLFFLVLAFLGWEEPQAGMAHDSPLTFLAKRAHLNLDHIALLCGQVHKKK